ncbi:hypothetical protein [Kitasatospora sp. NPDC059571]|uniref:hypothetical protein n=1 Tax=Kitasatospora sp. NPDC059571 TaxID=3346871 RepID=UPI00367DEF37
MGLSISVGLLDDLDRNDPEGAAHFRGAFDRLGRALAARGIDWQEPAPGGGKAPGYSAGFPYRYLHHLRRAYVLQLNGEPVTPARDTSPEAYARDQREVREEALTFSSHLLCHADDSGHYIPVDRPYPVFLPDEAGVAGDGTVGSVQRLRAELAALAPAIGIDPEAAQAAPIADDDPYEPEKFAWHRLDEACRASLATGRAITFH